MSISNSGLNMDLTNTEAVKISTLIEETDPAESVNAKATDTQGNTGNLSESATTGVKLDEKGCGKPCETEVKTKETFSERIFRRTAEIVPANINDLVSKMEIPHRCRFIRMMRHGFNWIEALDFVQNVLQCDAKLPLQVSTESVEISKGGFNMDSVIPESEDVTHADEGTSDGVSKYGVGNGDSINREAEDVIHDTEGTPDGVVESERLNLLRRLGLNDAEACEMASWSGLDSDFKSVVRVSPKKQEPPVTYSEIQLTMLRSTIAKEPNSSFGDIVMYKGSLIVVCLDGESVRRVSNLVPATAEVAVTFPTLAEPESGAMIEATEATESATTGVEPDDKSSMDYARWMRDVFEANTGEVLPKDFEQQCRSLRNNFMKKNFTALEKHGFNWIEALNLIKIKRPSKFYKNIKPDEIVLELKPSNKESEERVAQLVTFGFTQEEASKWSHQSCIPDHMLGESKQPIEIIPIRIAPINYPTIRFHRRESIELVYSIADRLKKDKGPRFALHFGTRFFVRGYLLVPCFKRFAAEWLEQIVPTLGLRIIIISRQSINNDVPLDDENTGVSSAQKCEPVPRNAIVMLREQITRTTGDLLPTTFDDVFQKTDKQRRKRFKQLLDRGYNWIEALHYSQSVPKHSKPETTMRRSFNMSMDKFTEAEIEIKPWVAGNKVGKRMQRLLTNGFTYEESVRLSCQTLLSDTGAKGVNNQANPIPVRAVLADYPKTLLTRKQAAAAIVAIHREVKKEKDDILMLHFGTKFFINGYILIPCLGQTNVDWLEKILPMLLIPLRMVSLLELEANNTVKRVPAPLPVAVSKSTSTTAATVALNCPGPSSSSDKSSNQINPCNRTYGLEPGTNNTGGDNRNQPCVTTNRFGTTSNKSNNPYERDFGVINNKTQFNNVGQAQHNSGGNVAGVISTGAGSCADRNRFNPYGTISSSANNQLNRGQLVPDGPYVYNSGQSTSGIGSLQLGPGGPNSVSSGGSRHYRPISNTDSSFSYGEDRFSRYSSSAVSSCMVGNQLNRSHNHEWLGSSGGSRPYRPITNTGSSHSYGEDRFSRYRSNHEWSAGTDGFRENQPNSYGLGNIGESGFRNFNSGGIPSRNSNQNLEQDEPNFLPPRSNTNSTNSSGYGAGNNFNIRSNQYADDENDFVPYRSTANSNSKWRTEEPSTANQIGKHKLADDENDFVPYRSRASQINMEKSGKQRKLV